jgi:uncharacterized membrane protein YagU involved in acid resistance
MRNGEKPIRAAILLGGFVAGTIGIGSAVLIYRVNPVVILHSIASGVLGRASFSEGAASAVLGLVLQWAMSLIIASIFVLSARVLKVLSHFWVAAGLAYGVAIFFVMNYVVVPLSAAMPRPQLPDFTPGKFAENMIAMLLFGLIVAFFARGEGGVFNSTPSAVRLR